MAWIRIIRASLTLLVEKRLASPPSAKSPSCRTSLRWRGRSRGKGSQGGSLNHLGVEVDDTSAVETEQARLADAGLASVDERGTTCCYARQDKFWVQGAPNGEQWEIYTVLEDSPTFWGQDGSRSSDTAEAALDPAQARPARTTQCCGGNEK